MRDRGMLLAAIVTVLGLGLSACGGDEPGPSATGTGASGEITVYSGRSEELVGPLIEKFEKASSVEVNVRYGDTAELATQILDEGENSPADVFFSQDAGALGALQSKGRLAELSDKTLARVDPRFRSKEGRWVGASGRVRVLAYNPDLVKKDDLPTAVQDLTEPQWKGKIGWAPTNASFQAFVTAFRKMRGQEAARAWLSAMKENEAKEYKDNDAIGEAVAEGEIPAGLVNHYYPFEIREEIKGAKIEAHYFGGGDVGGLVNVAGAAVIEGTDNAGAAARFVEYLVSDDAQKYFVEQTDEYPLVQGVAAPQLQALSDLEAPAIDLSDLADLEGTLKLLQDVGLV